MNSCFFYDLPIQPGSLEANLLLHNCGVESNCFYSAVTEIKSSIGGSVQDCCVKMNASQLSGVYVAHPGFKENCIVELGS